MMAMEGILYFVTVLLGITGLGRTQNDGYRSISSYKKDARYDRPVLAMANSPRCMFNGRPVEDGRTVSSPEPCLNCSCSRGILLCYLRTCTTVVATPGCQVVRKKGECCPKLECRGTTEYRTERTNEPNYKYRLRQDESSFFGLIDLDPRTERTDTSSSSASTRKPSPTRFRPNEEEWDSIKSKNSELHPLLVQVEDFASDQLAEKNETAGECYSKGYKYSEGMAMLSPTKCEYCYCIRGQQMCVRPKCHLNIEGCAARYQSGYTCCPSHYQCETNSQGVKDNEFLVPGKTTNTPQHKVSSCNVEGYDFGVGVAVPTNAHCQTCYCTQMGVVCRRLECSPIVPGCTPVIPDGHCCPTEYKCDEQAGNDTPIPVSHSTENYDVTVISPLGSDLASSPFESETTRNDYYESETLSTARTNTVEPESATDPDKQRITVELNDESDLESISVIPEENIAVLVVTTEKESDAPATSSETAEETYQFPETTKSSLSSLKHKIRTSSTKVFPSSTERDVTEETTGFTSSNPSITETANDKTFTNEEPYYGADEKDNYSYDYVELYEDVTHDEHETFAPFSDYTETTYDETTSTENTKGTPTSSRLKVKNKKPNLRPGTHKPPTRTTTYVTNSKFATEGVNLNRDTETEADYADDDHLAFSVFPSTKTEKYPTTKYTIYSTSSSKQRPQGGSSGGQKVKNKINRRPTTMTGSQHTSASEDVTLVHSTKAQTPTRTSESAAYTATNPDTKAPYATETSSEANEPYTYTVKSQTKISPYRKQKPKRPTQITPRVPIRSTKPIPQDLADLLWTITQAHSTQSQDTSTETYTTTTERGTSPSEKSDTKIHAPDLPTIILAAPKLIVEDTTTKGEPSTQQIQTTNFESPTTGSESPDSSPPPHPSFNFQSPEIIFSNHGPSTHRKPPKPSHDSEPPVEINNHKVTTRVRPQLVRFRPPSTPTVPQPSFVEISNHRPSNTYRRPVGKFPPYPNHNQRSEEGYRRESNSRGPHREIPGAHAESREDYDEYFYDVDQKRNPTTKVFTNMQSTQKVTGVVSVASTGQDSSRYPLPTTVNHPINTEFLEGDAEFKLKSDFEASRMDYPHKSDDVIGRSSINENEVSPETPMATTLSPSTKLIGVPTHERTLHSSNTEEDRLLRVESKELDSKFVDERFGSTANKFEMMDGRVSAEKPTLKPLSEKPDETPLQPMAPPKSEEDSKEINDVCFVDGRYYNSGEIIVKSNPCEMCRCFYGHPLCQVQQCPSPPNPSCILEYLPGYCCPRVTCGIKSDSSQPSSEPISAPDPTSQEIRSPIITSDNQWKPLPHGPIVRPADGIQRVDTSDTVLVTLPPRPLESVDTNNKREEIMIGESPTEKPKEEILDPSATTQPATTDFTTAAPTTTAPTTAAPVETTISTDLPGHFETTFFDFESITRPSEAYTMTSFQNLSPIFEPGFYEGSSQNSSGDIHDNSSGVRKVTNDSITLPPSKVSLSPASGERIATVLPVIHMLPTTFPVTEAPEGMQPVDNMLTGELPAELGGNLKVSGCNVYGKYYKINDIVTALSKPCSECVCSADGIACSTTC